MMWFTYEEKEKEKKKKSTTTQSLLSNPPLRKAMSGHSNFTLA
jgi:hypothetical protein